MGMKEARGQLKASWLWNFFMPMTLDGRSFYSMSDRSLLCFRALFCGYVGLVVEASLSAFPFCSLFFFLVLLVEDETSHSTNQFHTN
jgi:hypothetical protein